ncbi:hypothetical protein HK104_010271 [Borealophlyctis nickersoniae]|nr:hypothetical protein HK104_010271 [Borealophlyctis nickersoniae]
MTDVSSDTVTINVGGRLFTTTRSTLTRYPTSMLAKLAAWPHDETTETTESSPSSSTPLIDRNPDTFELVYLRDNRVTLSCMCRECGCKTEMALKALKADAHFYGLEELEERVDGMLGEKDEERRKWDAKGERYEQWVKKVSELQRIPISPDAIAHTNKTSPALFERVSHMDWDNMKEIVDQLEKLNDAELKAWSGYSWSLWKLVHSEWRWWSIVVHRHRVAK